MALQVATGALSAERQNARLVNQRTVVAGVAQ